MLLKIEGIGRLGRDPEMRYLPNGTAVTNMNVACNRVYNGSDGEKVTETIWIRLSAWSGLAETTNQYLKKGSLIYFEGRLSPDLETGSPRVFTRNDGTTGSSYEGVVSVVKFLPSGKDDQGSGSDQSEPQGFEDYPDDDISF